MFVISKLLGITVFMGCMVGVMVTSNNWYDPKDGEYLYKLDYAYKYLCDSKAYEDTSSVYGYSNYDRVSGRVEYGEVVNGVFNFNDNLSCDFVIDFKNMTIESLLLPYGPNKLYGPKYIQNFEIYTTETMYISKETDKKHHIGLLITMYKNKVFSIQFISTDYLNSFYILLASFFNQDGTIYKSFGYDDLLSLPWYKNDVIKVNTSADVYEEPSDDNFEYLVEFTEDSSPVKYGKNGFSVDIPYIGNIVYDKSTDVPFKYYPYMSKYYDEDYTIQYTQSGLLSAKIDDKFWNIEYKDGMLHGFKVYDFFDDTVGDLLYIIVFADNGGVVESYIHKRYLWK